MKQKANLIVLAVLLCSLALPVAVVRTVNAQEGQVTINPTDDTYVDFDNQNSNYGGQNNLQVSKYHDSFENMWEERIWLKFNLSSVPDGAIVDTATLRLYCSIASETYNVYAHACSDISWTELTLTWSNMPSYNASSMDTEQVATSYRWYNWSVTYAVQKAVDGISGGPGIVTIVLLETSFRGLISWVAFNSKESFSYYPELTVHWSGQVPEFPSFLILPLFMVATLLAIIAYKRKRPPL